MMYVLLAIFIAAVVVGIVFTAKRNNEIKQNGIETDAVVSRIKETEQTDEDGTVTGTTYTYYVTYQTQDGQTVEAKLASGKSMDNRLGGIGWDTDLREGSNIRIKYLPAKPKYVIRV